MRLSADQASLTFACPDCGAEQTPAPCPDCVSDDLRAALAEAGDTIVCRGCAATFDRPPLEG